MNCQNCNTIIENGYALCTACELRFAGTLLRLARDVTPLHDSLDATLHPGGHSPTRIQTATPPTPIRLDVLDLIDMLDATARELWRCLDGIARKVDAALDPPEQRREIGTCELCETMLTAGAADQWVTCPVCGREQRAQTVKLRRLKTLCWDDSRRGSAAEIAKVFTDAGITVKRHTLTVWKSRGKLDVTPQGISYSSVYRLVISGGLDKELTVTA